MQRCPECGNHDVHVRMRGGAPVHECGMCGATFGDRAVVAAADARDDAGAHGADDVLWPLARTLDALPGLRLAAAHWSDGAPCIECYVLGAAALVDLENLAKSLRLAAGLLRCGWRVELRFDHALVADLRCDAGHGKVDAAHDVALLTRQLERDRRSAWWRHAGERSNG